ncbi:regulatory protein IE2 [Human betaherpesvirus 5]|uniref:Regulatory protein IE2 n=1 Tax=Human cytomegalovirus TaxID=10359 RepID=A0A0G2UEQ5_HCMV|nr:regulatory protein IE2 [Human betaherpesvirus 5]
MESSAKRKMDPDNPDEGPSSKVPRPETPVTKATAFLQTMLRKEVNSQLSLGDPLFPELAEESLKTFEQVTEDCNENPEKDVLAELGDILAQAVNHAGIDSSSTGPTLTTHSCSVSSAPLNKPTPTSVAVTNTPLPGASATPELSPRKKPRKTTRPFKVIIKPPVPPAPIMLPLIKQEDIKPEPDFTIQYRNKIIDTAGCIVISDSEEEQGEEVETRGATASSPSTGSGTPRVTSPTHPLSQMNHPPLPDPLARPDEDSSSSSSSSCSSASDSESESEEMKCSSGGGASVTSSHHGRGGFGGAASSSLLSCGHQSGGGASTGPRKKKSKRISELDNEKVRNIMKDKNTPFCTPNVQTRRGRVKIDEVSRMFRNTNRSLEYKNLPFTIPSMHQVLDEAIKACKTMQVNNKGIQIIYTRNHEVKSEVDAVRCRLGTMCNLALSTPFLMEHTMPVTHPPEVAQRTADACNEGVKAAWSLKELHTHQLCPRSSDYRNMIIHAATPVDLLGALNLCLPLMQKFPKQVMVRIFSTNQGGFMLPIYETAAKAYAVGQFEQPTETPPEDLDTLSLAIEAAIQDLRNKSQ